MQVELQGKVTQVLPEQKFNGKNGEIVKNSFVIEWQDNSYTQKLCLEVVGADKFEKMSKAVRVGNEVLVKFNVTSREWQNRWFTTCQCFYCSTIGGQQQATTQQAQQQSVPQQQVDDNSLPF